MKKLDFSIFKIACIAMLLGISVKGSAQVAANYVFSQSNGTYTPLNAATSTPVVVATDPNPGGAPETAPMDDVTLTKILLPFTFTFNGTTYDTFDVSTNGFVGFGGTNTGSGGGAISGSNGNQGVIVPFGADLIGVMSTAGDFTIGSSVITNVNNTSFVKVGAPFRSGANFASGTTITSFTANTITVSDTATATATAQTLQWATGAIRTQVSGAAPNRTFTIEFSNLAVYGVPDNNMNFQVVLNEGGGVAIAQTISVIYGNVVRMANSSTGQIGIRGTTTADFNNRTTTTNWSATNGGLTNGASVTLSSTSFPPSGLTFTWTPTLCPNVTATAVTNITTGGVDLGWTSQGTQWEIEYGLGANYTFGSGTRVVTSTNPHTVTVPTSGPGTTYAFFVRNICGPNDTSGWSPRATFTTAPTCPLPTTLTNINITTNSVDLGWTETGGATQWEVEWGTGTSYALGTGTRFFTGSNPHTLAVTPNSNAIQYSFFVRAVCGVNDTSGWSSRKNFTILPTCPIPTDETADNITLTSADLGWTENGNAAQWQIEYDTSGFTQGTGTRVIATTNPHPLSALNVGTAYDYYVRAICGPNDTSAWSTGLSFATECNAVTSFPWTESFEDTSSTLVCWKSIDGNGDGDAWVIDQNQPNTGDNGVSLYTDGHGGDNSDWLISPPITLTGGQRLVYYYSTLSASEPNDYTVKLSTSGPDTSNFTNIIKPLTTVSNTGYQQDIIDLTAFTGTVHLAFHVPAGGLDGWVLYIDDITVEDMPACVEPTALTVANRTNSSFDISWTSGGSNFIMEYGPAGYTPGTGATAGAGGTLIPTPASPQTISGLPPNKAYSVYIRQDCSSINNGYSINADINTGTTPLNDECSGAYSLTLNVPYSDTSTLATNDPLPSLTCGSTTATTGNNKGLWYSFTAPYTGAFTLSGCSAPFDNYGRVYEGTCGSFTTCLGFGDDDCSSSPLFDFNGVMGNTYYILIGSFGTGSGTGVFPIQISTPLAIKLDKLSVLNVGSSNRVEWNTLSEAKTDKFELQRSANGKDFATILTKDAKGEASRYTYVDEQALQGINYYRLKMIEASGKVEYSKIVSAVVSGKGFSVSAYPNPVSDNLTVVVSGTQGSKATLQVTDVTGKVLRTIDMNGNQKTINLNGLANGIYLIKYADTNHTQTIRINKQ